MSKAALAVKLTTPDAIKRAEKMAPHNWEAFINGVTVSGYHFDTVAQAFATLNGLDGEAIDSIVREHCAIVAIPFFPGFYDKPGRYDSRGRELEPPCVMVRNESGYFRRASKYWSSSPAHSTATLWG